MLGLERAIAGRILSHGGSTVKARTGRTPRASRSQCVARSPMSETRVASGTVIDSKQAG